MQEYSFYKKRVPLVGASDMSYRTNMYHVILSSRGIILDFNVLYEKKQFERAR